MLLTKFKKQVAKILLSEATVASNIYGKFIRREPLTYAVYVSSTAAQTTIHKELINGLEHANINNYYFLNENQKPPCWRTGLWVLFPGNHKADYATNLVIFLIKRFKKIYKPLYIIVFGQQSHNECIVHYSNSTAIAQNFFYTRLNQLHKYIASENVDSSKLIFITENHNGVQSEFHKFTSSVSENMDFTHETMVVDDDFAPTKSYTISSCDLNNQNSMEKIMQETNILILTANTTETRACLDLIKQRGKSVSSKAGKCETYWVIERINNYNIFLVQSSQGSIGVNAAQLVAIDAIDELDPLYVIACGIAFGVDDTKQQFCDVLVSKQIKNYEPQKLTPSKSLSRGDKVPADPKLLSAAQAARILRPDLRIQEGLILSGEKLVNKLQFRDKLLEDEEEAIGGEMEASGIFNSCFRRSRRCIIIKSICDFGYNKTNEYQEQAALNSFDFLFSMIEVL
jgi:nucleoside phosphorylase